MNGTETIVSSGIILDVSGFQALPEEGEVYAANIITSITITNTTDSNAAAVMTTPIPPMETIQENTTTTTERERRNKKNNYNISKLVHIFLSLQSNKR